MQPKNLGWKFAFVGLLIALCVYLIWAKGMRQGIDLKGGHILTFEVQTDPTEGQREDLIPQVISTLKQRIDPNGLYSLEWKPVGTNRFEVRMPLGSDEAVRAKQAYLQALDALQGQNIQRSDVQEVAAGGARRQAIIDAAAQIDPQRAGALGKVAQVSDELAQAARKVEALKATGATTPQELKTAEDARDNAQARYDQAVREVLATNVNAERLGQIVALYVADREVRFLPKSEVQTRRKSLAEQLEQLEKEHPAAAQAIESVAAAYKNWSEKRTGLDDPADLKRLVASAGVLEFRIAPTLPGSGELALGEPQYQTYMDQLNEQGPMVGRNRNDPFQWFPVRTSSEERFSTNLVIGKYAGKKYVLLYNQPDFEMTHAGGKAWALTRANRTVDQMNKPAVAFQFDTRGAGQMGLLTSKNQGHFMAILLDDDVYSAPVIKATIYDHGIIEGSFTTQQVTELVRTLEAGALQGRVNENPVSEKTIAPSIGEDNRKAGLHAAFWSLLATVAFMIVYYMLAGSVADAAMLLNLLLTLGAMSFVDAVFTLPGIAGLTLSTAMAVDANVLIYERLREEQRKSLSMRMAVRNAYTNAFSAIFDSNITTIIAAAILWWVGTEEVKGFAITLGLGVLFNLFTAVAVTRWVFQWLLERGLLTSHVRMLRLIGVPNVDWMGKRRIFWVASVATSIIGLAALFWQGKDVLGIEFSSGTQAVFNLRMGAMIPAQKGKAVVPERGQVEDDIVASADDLAAKARAEADRLAAALPSAPAAEKDGIEKQLAKARAEAGDLAKFDLKVETILNRNKVDDLLEQFDANHDGVLSPEEWADGGGDKDFFAFLDADGDGKLDRKQVEQRLPERSYQVSTKIADADLVRLVVRNAFGQSLDMRSSVQFELKKSGAMERLNIALESKDQGIAHITTELAGKVDAAARSRFTDFIGGAMFVVEKVNPPITEEELSDRIRTMRLQPDFAGYQFNRTAVLGLQPGEGARTFASFAVLTLNPGADYASRPDEWKAFAGQELKLLTAALSRQESLESVTKFDAAVAGEARQLAVIACVLAWLAIIVYLWVRFGQARWGVAAVVCLVHDLIISIGLVAMSGWIGQTRIGQALLITPVKVDMTVIAAFLTIIGYSVNDTIVVFDRIRENRGKLKYVDETIINHAINQTLSRTLLTSAAVIIALFIMYAIGGAGIHPFCYAMLPGVLVGTYSSIAVAAPLLLGFRTAMIGRAVHRPAPAPVAPQPAEAPAPEVEPEAEAEQEPDTDTETESEPVRK